MDKLTEREEKIAYVAALEALLAREVMTDGASRTLGDIAQEAIRMIQGSTYTNVDDLYESYF